MTETRPFWLAGRLETGPGSLDVRHPWDDHLVATVSTPDPAQVERAVAAAWSCRTALATAPAHVRSGALLHVATRLVERTEEVADLIVEENGKPLKWAQAEVVRAASTFRWAAEEARRWSGEIQRLDTDPSGDNRMAIIRRVPRGPVLAITPFNFPLNLVAHKVAPALAVGAPVLIKPAPSTPLSSLLLGELLSETALPDGSWSVLPVLNDAMEALVADGRLPVVSFTGSGRVGWHIRDSVPRKHVTLELGGNAAVIVCKDFSSDEDLDRAADRIAVYGTYQAGQSCVSVQRVIVHHSVQSRFIQKVSARLQALVTGDPRKKETDIGPLVDESAARRVEQWVSEAVEGGATLVYGGQRNGSTMAPTLLTHVDTTAKVWCEEVFGPVIVVSTFSRLGEAFDQVNASRYGLQAGIFTHDMRVAFEAQAFLDVGGIVVGDVPSYRADQMPYGGVKESGTGREGVAAAMADLTHEKVLVLTGVYP